VPPPGDPELRAKLLRKIGTAQKLFSKSKWKEAEQEAEDSGRAIGDVLLEMKLVSKDQLRGLERAVTYRIGRDEDKKLSKVIVDSGYADEATVEAALQEQKDIYAKSGDLARICDLLVTGGTLSESQHLAARKIFDISKLTQKDADSDEESDRPAD